MTLGELMDKVTEIHELESEARAFRRKAEEARYYRNTGRAEELEEQANRHLKLVETLRSEEL